MDLPATWLGWVNLVAYGWAVLAYGIAAIAGIRALRLAYDGPPPLPLCIMADASRWVLGLKMSDQHWRPRDFMALGIAFAVIACLIAAFSTLEFLTEFSWRKLGKLESLRRAAADVVTGSALILLHCAAALRFKQEGEADDRT